MGNVGLLLVGVVLLVNGLVILSVVPPRSAALLNIFVGTAQVVLPTIVLIQNVGDAAVVNSTWPSYLFGFTYLYYGLGIYLDLEPQGLGWFSSFVAAIAAFAVGGALLLTGLVLGVVAIDLDAQLEPLCPDRECPANLRADVERYRSIGHASTGTLIAGGVVVGAGITMIVVSMQAPGAEARGFSLGLRGAF